MKTRIMVVTIVLTVLSLLAISCQQQPQQRYTEMEQKNVDLLKWLYAEGVNKQDVTKWDTILTDNWVRHCEAMPPGMREIKGLDPMKAFLASNFTAFPDWHEEISVILADSNYVGYMTTGTGTQTGPMEGFPITNKPINIQTFVFQRFEGSKIAETWVSWDNVAFLSQLELFPPPADTAG